MNFIQFFGAIEIGLIYGLVAVGVYLSFRILDFPDLTVDGSFPMGAAIAGILIIDGMDPWIATGFAMLGGAAAGLVTACLNVYGRILHLLASILTMTALYSINLRIMGKPNISLLSEQTIFQRFDSLMSSLGLHMSHMTTVTTLTALIILASILGLYWFLSTQVGLSMRATGKNPTMATAQGIKINFMILTGIALSNSLIALSGAIFTQSQGFADVTMGVGTIIVGLAAVLIGEAIIHTRSVLFALIACVLGAIVYRLVIALALNSDILGLETSDLNLVSALLVALAMVLSQIRHGIKRMVVTSRERNAT